MFQGELITEAVSICKKCISPKPPRTHHCSVCNRCILKMDHHCRIPLCSLLNLLSVFMCIYYFFKFSICIFLNANVAWLNNCVGYRNHRYFFLYMVYMVVGVFFVIICGFDIAYTVIMLAPSDLDEPELEGHSVKINKTGALIPVVSH